MSSAAPSSRSPGALRGDRLRAALRELGGDHVASARPTEVRVRPAAAAAPELPGVLDAPPIDDDEPAPVALRPDQLARWLERRRD